MQKRVFAAAVALCLAGGVASAASVTMNFTGVGKKKTGLNLVDGATNINNVTAGELKWHVTASTFNPTITTGDDIKTFCTDLYQTAGNGTMQVQTLNTAPQPGAGMGWFRATMISKLYQAHFANSDDSDANAAAFQIAIWEIIYEANFTNATTGARGAAGIDVTSGDFRLTNSSTVQTKANQYLDAAFAEASGMALMALVAPGTGQSNPNLQDQIYFAPLPAASAMAGLGMLAIGARRRRA